MIAADAAFDYSPSFDVIHGTSTQELTMPAFTETLVGCQIMTIEVDSDNALAVSPPTGVSLKSGCTQPCLTLTFDTTAPATITYFLRVTAEGTGNSEYFGPINANIVCNPANYVFSLVINQGPN